MRLRPFISARYLSAASVPSRIMMRRRSGMPAPQTAVSRRPSRLSHICMNGVSAWSVIFRRPKRSMARPRVPMIPIRKVQAPPRHFHQIATGSMAHCQLRPCATLLLMGQRNLQLVRKSRRLLKLISARWMKRRPEVRPWWNLTGRSR